MSELTQKLREVESATPVPGSSQLVLLRAGGRAAQIPRQELDRLRGDLRGALTTGLRRIEARIAGGRIGHETMKEIREDQWIVGGISDVLGGVSLPPLDIWNAPANDLATAQAALRAGQLSAAAELMERAEQESVDAHQRYVAYREGTITGAGRAETTLVVTRDVSAVTVGLIATVTTGGTAAMLIGTGYGAALQVAQQGSEVAIGLRQRVDWAGIGFDAVVGMILGRFTGALGSKVGARLLGNPAVASLGRQALSRIVSDLAAGSAQSALHTAARAIFDNVRGAPEAPTMEQFIDQLADQLTDPKSAFMNILMGEVSRRVHTAATRPRGGGGAGGGRPSKPPAEPEPPTRTKTGGAGPAKPPKPAPPQPEVETPTAPPKAAAASEVETPAAPPKAAAAPEVETPAALPKAAPAPPEVEPPSAPSGKKAGGGGKKGGGGKPRRDADLEALGGQDEPYELEIGAEKRAARAKGKARDLRRAEERDPFNPRADARKRMSAIERKSRAKGATSMKTERKRALVDEWDKLRKIGGVRDPGGRRQGELGERLYATGEARQRGSLQESYVAGAPKQEDMKTPKAPQRKGKNIAPKEDLLPPKPNITRRPDEVLKGRFGELKTYVSLPGKPEGEALDLARQHRQDAIDKTPSLPERLPGQSAPAQTRLTYTHPPEPAIQLKMAKILLAPWGNRPSPIKEVLFGDRMWRPEDLK